MQFQDPRYPHLFAVGDIADSGAHKAAQPGMMQAVIAGRNIARLIEGHQPTGKMNIAPSGIHLILGLTRSVVFRNPDTAAGETETDMGIEGIWTRLGAVVNSSQDCHL
ncbi:hypothetical protein MYCTH_103320 [Thermothelomyces thermophilus ATCC 42464]|uniref:FAD/NAD(P)-binding domain-containing protein n=1 Tax=Thermothelomyces thermophilus (strain ATCC 42464 / BCRC 31852 / DSM 1799) TaxID=573729 RepID=G2QKK7_THET4|nr:uncharacterized protein MYCTH_103320 [Thermothelomyces thermophilus ATCC 42464]AEO60113.1 hypothetical protein MYCTH_103320 [Thermothelomyces thermophilus ATCC 42464]